MPNHYDDAREYAETKRAEAHARRIEAAKPDLSDANTPQEKLAKSKQLLTAHLNRIGTTHHWNFDEKTTPDIIDAVVTLIFEAAVEAARQDDSVID